MVKRKEMKREIKFRAWRGNEMIYQTDKTSSSAAHFFNRIYEQHPLMQYTGLKDKNGKEVYEGDLITWPHLNNRETCEVYYNESEFAFVARPVDKNIELEAWLDGTCEVIGNIYESL